MSNDPLTAKNLALEIQQQLVDLDDKPNWETYRRDGQFGVQLGSRKVVVRMNGAAVEIGLCTATGKVAHSYLHPLETAAVEIRRQLIR